MNGVGNIAEFTPLAGFVLLVILIATNIVLQKKKGVKLSKSTSSKRGKIKWFYPVFAIVLIVFIAEITFPFTQFSMLPEALSNPFIDSVPLGIAGIVVIFLSVFLMKTTLKDFGTSLRFGLNESIKGKLVTTGIFARSRNPFFVSILLYFAGTALVFPNLFFSVFIVLAITGIHFFILKEEKFMQKFYGEEYFEFRKKVRRYF